MTQPLLTPPGRLPDLVLIKQAPGRVPLQGQQLREPDAGVDFAAKFPHKVVNRPPFGFGQTKELRESTPYAVGVERGGLMMPALERPVLPDVGLDPGIASTFGEHATNGPHQSRLDPQGE